MENRFEYIVPGTEKGERLDRWLSFKKEVGLARSRIHTMLLDGQIEVNGEVPKAGYKVKANDRITVTIPPAKISEITAEQIPLNIIYEDSDLIVMNKPRGMVVHPAAGNYSGTLVNALLAHCKDLSGIGGVERPGIVHRLDKETSGLIVAAKNDLTHNALARQFRSREIKKEYLALVHGIIKEDEGTIEKKIGRHPKDRKKMAVFDDAKARRPFERFVSKKGSRDAISLYKVLERFGNYTLVQVALKTGRTHQIRVHLSSIGHPLVGDSVYGGRHEDFDNLSGQMLHAKKLSFIHPRSGKEMLFEADLPKDMEEVIRKLREK